MGADGLTPIDLGGLACHTEVLQTQGWLHHDLRSVGEQHLGAEVHALLESR